MHFRFSVEWLGGECETTNFVLCSLIFLDAPHSKAGCCTEEWGLLEHLGLIGTPGFWTNG